MSKLFLFFWVLCREVIVLRGDFLDLWEEDLSSSMKIGVSASGYKSVDLKCDPQHFDVNVTLNRDFEGVVYTRGSFNNQNFPCFKRHNENKLTGGENLLISMKIPFQDCGTVKNTSEIQYTNTLVVQHDPELIMPGDAAFRLDCAFTPDGIIINDFGSFTSKITVVDADPLAEEPNPVQNMFAFSQSEKVTFVPDSKKTNDEL